MCSLEFLESVLQQGSTLAYLLPRLHRHTSFDTPNLVTQQIGRSLLIGGLLAVASTGVSPLGQYRGSKTRPAWSHLNALSRRHMLSYPPSKMLHGTPWLFLHHIFAQIMTPTYPRDMSVLHKCRTAAEKCSNSESLKDEVFLAWKVVKGGLRYDGSRRICRWRSTFHRVLQTRS